MAEDNDPELKMALELSKRSFAAEEAKRKGMDNLISFDCPEEKEREQKLAVLQQINRMHQPPPPANAIGWNMMHHSQSAGTLPRFPPQPQFAGPSNSPQIPPHRHTTEPRMTLDMPIPVMSTPPNSYHSHTFQNYGFNTPTIMYPQSPLMVHPIHLTTPCRQTPIPLGRVDFSPRPVHWNQDFLRNREQPTTSQPGSSKSEETTLSVPSPRQNEVYLAYARIKSPKRGTDGDLIDLSDGKDYDRIRRDFDVLYEPPPGDIAPSMPPAILSKTNSLHNDYVTTPTRRSEGAGTSKDDYEVVTPRRPASAIYPALKTQTPEKLSIDRFQIIEKKPDVEAQLERLVKRFGRTADCSQFFSSATVEYMTTNVKSVKVTIEKDHTWPTGGLRKLTQTVETDKTVGLFLAETLSALLDESQLADGVPTEAYGLKEYGLDEFLPEQELIGQNIFVGKYLLMDKDVKLEIGRKIPADRLPTDERPYTYADVRANKRTPKKTIRMSLASPTILDKDDVEQKLAQLKDNMEDFDSKAGDVHALSVANSANGVRKRVEELCKLLSRIEPGTLHNTLRRYLTAEKTDRESARHDFLLAIHSFILAYCRSTTSSYTIRPLIEKKKPLKRVIECAEIVQVLVQSVHNLKNEWLSEYQSFFMTINLHHGTDDLGGHKEALTRAARVDSSFPHVSMDFVADFKKELRHCPRESRLVFLLWGVDALKGGPTIDHTAVGGDPDLRTYQYLAQASLPMFDHNNILRQGQIMLPLSTQRDWAVQPWGGQPLLCSERDAVVIISLPGYDYDVHFPDISDVEPALPMSFYDMPEHQQEEIEDLLELKDPEKLEQEWKELLWEKRYHLMNSSEALPLVLASVPDWAYGWLPNIYPLIEGWTILSPVEAIQLLLPQYPDRVVRSKAVEWIRRASSDFLFNFMPQLVEVLRFELYEDSSLAELLLELSYKDLRFAYELYWQLQQRVDHCPANDFSANTACYVRRCQMLQKELLSRKESALLTHSIYLQHKLLNTLDDLQRELKITTDSEKLNILRQRLGFLDGDLLGRNVRLPILPSFKATGIDVAKCGIFNSNAKPLRIVFRGLKSKFSVIHKDGDDMRQDALVIQLVRVMNDIWLCEGLDLRMITFRCATVGYRKGMAELVSDCQTLCDIQKAEGMAGVFKDDVLCKWLEKYNSSEYSYKVAEDNFRRSCAGWCVATFVLGIGDRHNDNILLTSMGHVFHIDFGKYMGDWQMAGPVKRDRVPFVFTKEMYAVINRGEVQGANDGYQSFIDFCCQAFNHLRSKHAHILSLLKIMQCSDIPGINAQSLHFVQKNLMLGMSDTDATAEFTKMITISLGSTFVRLNFFAHTFAQMLSGQTVRPIDQPDTLSFVPHRHTMETDGRIQDVKLLYPEKRMMPQKVYLYRMVVYRDQETIATTVYRSFAEFEELALKLKMRHHSSAPNWVKENARSNNREVALKRLSAMKDYLRVLLHGAPSAVRNDPLVYTFFHIILRDNTLQNGPEVLEPAAGRPVQIRLLLSWQATTSQLKVFVGHVKHLPMLTTGQAPDSYVKTYLRPDQNSKKKTKIVRSSLNPTFNEELCYDIGEVRDVKRFLDGHSLDVSIWSAGGLKDNNKMFHTQIQLHRLYNKTADRKGNLSWDDWHDLSKFGLHLPHS